jgi:hypothetical protein
MMKRIIVILFMIVAAAALLQAASSSKSDSIGSVFFTPGTDIKKVEDKMAEALVRLDSWKRARAEEKREPLVSEIEKAKLSSSPPVNLALNNSTLNNISINSSLGNSSLLNSSAVRVADANELDANNLSARQNGGSSSKGSLNGYYGMTASRHEMGKSGIKSKMFLSGSFEMDKSVKFQDQGVD